MRNTGFFISIVCLAIVSQLAFANKDVDIYKTEMGSILELQGSKDNTLIGSFMTMVASKECQQVIGVKKPIIGYMHNMAIAFSVNYPECDAIVTFVGYMGKDRNSIDTNTIILHQQHLTSTEIRGERSLNNVMFNRTQV